MKSFPSQPKRGELDLRRRIAERLRPRLSGAGLIGERLPFCALPEFELRVADVALGSQKRWSAIDLDDYMSGAPDLVVLLVTPDARARLRQTVSLCLNTGAVECWLVDRNKRSVTVVRKDGTTTLYDGDAEVPLTAFGSDSLRVADIFG